LKRLITHLDAGEEGARVARTANAITQHYLLRWELSKTLTLGR
jgi:hypothetical protein